MRRIVTAVVLTMLSQPVWANAATDNHQRFCDLLAQDVGQAEANFIFLDNELYKKKQAYLGDNPTITQEEYFEYESKWDVAHNRNIKELIELSTIYKNLCKE